MRATPGVVLAVGGLLVPYATLWLTRSAGARRAARRVGRGGHHRRLALLGAGVGLLALGSGGLVPRVPPVPAWATTTLALVGFALVDLLVAADRLRAYPDDRALHYDLPNPRTWPATSARTVSAWGVVTRRHPFLAPALAACSALFALGPRFVGGAWWLAPAAGALVLSACCLPLPRLVALPAGFVRAVESRTSTG
jgi:hypothetical protein